MRYVSHVMKYFSSMCRFRKKAIWASCNVDFIWYLWGRRSSRPATNTLPN